MVDLSEFEEETRGPGTKPGEKVARFLAALPDDLRDKAEAALASPEFGSYAIERVFARWAKGDPSLQAPGHTAIQKFRDRD